MMPSSATSQKLDKSAIPNMQEPRRRRSQHPTFDPNREYIAAVAVRA